MDITALHEAEEEADLVEGHAHNLLAVNSSFPFIRCFSESDGDALSYAPHSLSFKRSLKEVAELYGVVDKSLDAVEEHRRVSGFDSISSRCFGAAKISAILFDDGLDLDKMHDIDWHKTLAPVVGRILRIESLAEQILNQDLPSGCSWTLDVLTETFVGKLKSFADKIFGLKSIAAYRSGLEINTNVAKIDAEEGLSDVMKVCNIRCASPEWKFSARPNAKVEVKEQDEVYGCNMDKVKEWTAALTKVANLSGWHLNNYGKGIL